MVVLGAFAYLDKVQRACCKAPMAGCAEGVCCWVFRVCGWCQSSIRLSPCGCVGSCTCCMGWFNRICRSLTQGLPLAVALPCVWRNGFAFDFYAANRGTWCVTVRQGPHRDTSEVVVSKGSEARWISAAVLRIDGAGGVPAQKTWCFRKGLVHCAEP